MPVSAPTRDEAAALALYEAAQWVKTFRDSMRQGSGDRRAADRIHGRLMDQARRRQLGEDYDPAINATDAALRRQIAQRTGRSPLADKVVTTVWETWVFEEYADAEAAAEAVLRLLSEAINYTHNEPVISAGELEALADEIKAGIS